MRFLIAVFFSLLFMSCTNNDISRNYDLQGHRGTRGLMPENTIPAFLKAVDLGVDTIELDVVVSKDDKIVVSHEPWFNSDISTKPDGSPVAEQEEMQLNMYQMTYQQIQRYDVGRKGHPSFPNQKRIKATKPLLREAIQAVENYTAEQKIEHVQYNIEMKSEPDRYGIYYPQPAHFAQLLNNLITELDQEFQLEDRIIIQSFDPAALVEFHKLNTDVRFAMLVSNTQPIQEYIQILGFTPDIWSPNYQFVTHNLIRDAHERGMKVIPWTVNTIEEMNYLLHLGVDGIITDYPDSALSIQQN